MKKRLSALLLLFAAGTLAAASFELPGGILSLPSAGIINPAEGTVEITVTPAGDVKDLRNDWSFAFVLPGKENSNAERTVLGIYTPSGNPETEHGLRGILRGAGGQVVYLEDKASPIRAGETVNLALSWGPAGAVFSVNGKELRRAPFKGPLIDAAPMLNVITRSPFYPSRLKVSAAQLPSGMLNASPEKPFTADAECTLLADDLADCRFFAAPFFRNRNFVSLLPFGKLSDRVVRENEPVSLDFVGCNYTERPVELPVEFRIREFRERAAHTVRRTVTLPPGCVQQIFRLDPGPLAAGLHSIEVHAGDEPVRKLKLSVLPAVSAAPEGKLAEYLGLAAAREPELFKKLNIKWMRSWGHPDLNWFQVEPVRGKFDFRTADRIIDAYRACNVNILAVLGYPPLWAAEPPPAEGERAKFRYRRGEPGRWKPRSVDEWRNYVRNVAGHFTGRVRHYEIYNEVDFHPPGFAESFSGTTEEYFELLKSASQEIRAADTANQVLVSGFSNTPTVCDMEMPEKLVSLGAGDWVDIWNVHSYRAKVGMAEMKALADRTRPGMPIWQTEQMWHVINDPARRSYLTAAINLWFLELGFDKYFSFGWGRDTLSDEHTNSPEPSLQAFAVSQYFLDRCDARRGVVKGLPEGEFDVNCELVRRDGNILSAVGSSAGSYTVEFQGKILEARDTMGRRIDCSGNRFRTGGEICYLVSPEPLEIVSATLDAAGELLSNTGFEDLVGDALTGIERCTFASWITRVNFDPGAKISIRPEGGSGRYAAELRTTGKGRVYLFEYIKPPATGAYRVTAHFKNLSGNAKPYISVFDTSPGAKLLLRKDYPTPPADRFEKLTFDFTLDKLPADNLAVIFGVDGGSGAVLLDDVGMVRHVPQKLDDENAVFVPLPEPDGKTVLSAGTDIIDLDTARALGRGRKVFGGYPFELGGGWLAAAGTRWSNPAAAETPAVRGRCRSIVLLLAAMYNDPAQGAKLGALLLRYADGSEAELPLRSNVELRDWYLAGAPADPIPAAAEFIAPDLKEFGFYTAELANPHPERELVSIGLAAEPQGGIIAVRAVTLAR